MSAAFLTADGPIEIPERVLVVVAHPDDIDFGVAGTVAQLTAAGSYVAYCLVTSGEAGEDDMTVTTQELSAMREAEQTAAAAEVGVDTLHFLRHPDGMVEANFALRCDISRIIRIEKPDVVITQSPHRNFDSVYGSHPDHLETAEATLRAVYPDARNPRAFTTELLDEGYEPHTVNHVWVSSVDQSLFVDVTNVFEAKLRALRSHQSQVAKRDAEFDLKKLMWEWGERLAAAGADKGIEHFANVEPGDPNNRIAEAYRVLDTA
ncbi:MAG: LmbE family N-acetylglucosaminyl deacetylase [Verrucomicrobiales bacterium]|jgi:LmbE family N-acetylglucosaminyl deacetylase